MVLATTLASVAVGLNTGRILASNLCQIVVRLLAVTTNPKWALMSRKMLVTTRTGILFLFAVTVMQKLANHSKLAASL